MGLQGVEMVVLGFNTPSVNSQRGAEGIEDRLFHHRLSCQAGAYQNATWVVAVAKAGSEDGNHLMGGTLIVDPNGKIVGELPHEDDGVLVHPLRPRRDRLRQGDDLRLQAPSPDRALQAHHRAGGRGRAAGPLIDKKAGPPSA